MGENVVVTHTTGQKPAKVRRREDLVLLTGKGQYVGDMRRPGMLFVHFVYSPYPHARIQQIDVSAALAHPGVVKVVTAQDLHQLGGLLTTMNPQASWTPQPCLADGAVHFIGEPVAAVVAESETSAKDAADLIEVDYEVLPAVAGLEAALRDESENVVIVREGGTGDVDASFAQADTVVSLRLLQPRLAPAPMECRAILAEGHADGTLSIWASKQSIPLARLQLALILQLPPPNIAITIPHVGGAFGGKTRLCGEEAVTAYLAHTLQRPVRWLEERSANLVSMGHGRGMLANMEAAVQKDGTIRGLKAEIFADIGGYPGDMGLLSASSTVTMISGSYAIPAIRTILKGVKTNAAPPGAYRGAGRPEASYFIERTIEAIARALKLDPIEVRKRNFIAPEAFPYVTATGASYDSGAYAQALDILLEKANYQALRAEQASLRQQGRYMGIGMSVYVESSAVGGQGMTGRPDAAQTRITPEGTIVVETAAVDSGQGHETAFATLVASEFAVPLEQVEVRIGDSPHAHALGTFGSRSIAVGGSAITLAARDVKKKVLLLASHLLEAAESDLELVAGRVQVIGAPGKFYTLGQLAGIAENVVQREHYPENLRNELLQGLCSMEGFEPEGLAYPFGAHLAVVEVDIETGEVKLQRYVGVDDCGRVIVPMLAEGQLHGGLAQGIGQALYEQVLYTADGQVLSGTLMDYAIPLAAELPNFELSHTETPSPRNVLGAKGIGESGCTGAPTAITNAVLDALAPLGVTTLDMPLTPEKVWRAVHTQ